uniref:Uncharacterized protein n=1 Tax=Anguilla anguilla TaxID=7936 RepID=A0A0E9VML5_ANGAN
MKAINVNALLFFVGYLRR